VYVHEFDCTNEYCVTCAVQLSLKAVSPSNFTLSVGLIRPFTLVVATSRSDVACVHVKSSGDPLPTVARPLIVPLAMFACFAFVTTPLSTVHVAPLPDTTISLLSQSVRAGIVRSPLPSTVTPFIVLMFVPETRVSCFVARALVSTLSAFKFAKFVFIFAREVGLIVSDDITVCIVDI
jgi:hypothetical protein